MVKRGVFPGRFQPPHYGHVKAIKWALDKVVDELIVIIGSAQESFTLKNPLTAGERFYLLDKLLRSEAGDYLHRIRIVPVLDINSNKQWVRYLEMLLPPFHAVVSGNPLVQVLFEDSGYEVYSPPMFSRSKCSGTRIRRTAIEGGVWEECVPEIILDDLLKIGFADRLKRLSRGDE